MAPGLDVHVGGSMLTATQSPADFIKQIFGLQGEVFADKHSRIKLHSDVTAQHVHSPSNSTQHPAINGLTNGFGPPNAIGLPNGTSHGMNDKPYLNGDTGASASTASFHFSDAEHLPAPAIDQTSSQNTEVTLKAEQQMERQRIERALKDQYEVRKQTAWSEKDGNIDMSARFDISETLEKASRIAKHVSGLKVVADRSSSPSEPMHTNSYYSSQDNWSSQGSQSSAKAAITDQQQQMKPIHDQSANVLMQHQQPQAGQYLPGKLLSIHVTSLNQSFSGISQTSLSSFPELSSQIRCQESEDLEEGEREESEEYEPPAADELGAVAPLHEVARVDRRISPPLPAASVIRNHIETPFAPQPERVSPLALTRMPQVANDSGRPPSPRVTHPPLSNQAQNRISRQESPRAEQTQEDSSGSAQGKKKSPRNEAKDGQIHKKRKDRRKRKLRADAAEEQNRRPSNKRVARSPGFEPHIKEEPISPPLGAISELPAARRRQPLLVDDDVEMMSPRRPELSYGREYLERPVSPSTVQVSSRPAYRRVVERDDQDLRRYASLQHARRPFSPQTRIAYEEPGLRAVSQAYIERPIHRDGSIRPTAQSQHLQRVLSPAPVYIDDEYAAPPPLRRVQASSAMPPPPSRPEVVVDQYGNRYIAAPPEPAYETRRASAAPGPSRRFESDTYERAVTRAPARPADPYDDEDEVMQTSPRMAPQSTSTRYVIDEQGREIEMERISTRQAEMQDNPRSYREQAPQMHQLREMERAYSVRPREEERPIVNRSRDRMEMAPPSSIPQRQSVVYDEAPQGYTLAQPASRIQRSYSVRPSAFGDAEYSAPPSAAMRASVQPQTRQQGREYLVRDAVPRGYRAVSIMQEGVSRGEDWATVPPRMEAGQGRMQYTAVEGDGGMQRIQSGRKEYVDDLMEGIDDGYNGMHGRRVEYRY